MDSRTLTLIHLVGTTCASSWAAKKYRDPFAAMLGGAGAGQPPKKARETCSFRSSCDKVSFKNILQYLWIVSARGPSLTKESEGVSWISGLVSSLANGCYLCHDCTLYIYYSFKCIKIEYHHLSLLFAIACSSYNTAFVLISHAPSKDIYIVAVLIRSHPSNDIHFLVVQLLSPSAALTRCWMLIPTMTCEVRVVRFLFMSASSSHPPPVQYLHEVFNSMLVELTPLLWKWPTLETSDMWFLNKVASLVANADVKGFWERRIQLKVRLKMRRNPG